MTDIFTDTRAVSALLIVVILPILIIATSEIEERLRQRDSPATPVVSMLRNWTIPLLTVWVIAVALLGLERDRLFTRIVATAFVFSLAASALAFLRLLVTWWRNRPADGEVERQVPQLLQALPRVAVIIATGWVLLDTVWGIDLSAALTALGVTSLVISFALQDTLSGLASGLLLLSDAPFQPGDWIRTGEIEGRVVDINWRSSRVQNRSGDLMIVPNAQLAGATVVNYDRPTRLHRVVVPVQVAYVNPPTVAKEMLLAAARATTGVLAEPSPNVRVVQVDDPLMGYEVHLWIDDYERAPQVSTEFSSLVWYQSHRRDVPLPSPAYDLYVYDGVQNAEAGRPNRAEIRRRLRGSPLLDQLSEDDIDRLAVAAKPARFAAGELILEATANKRDLYVITQGRAQIEVTGPDGLAHEAAQLAEAEIFGPLGASRRWQQPPRILAVEDCETVIIDEAAAGDVASRNPGLAAALNQLATTRDRRIDRIMDDEAERFSEDGRLADEKAGPQ